MTHISYTLFILITSILNNIYANDCNLIEDKAPSLQLFRHLFCEYDSSMRPTRDPKNTTTVTVIFIPKMINFEDYSNTLNVHTWLYMSWHDEHLQWKGSDFNGINTIWVQSNRLWTPDFAIQNAASADSIQLDIPMTNCMISYEGGIVCVPPVLFSTRCNADYSYWPFDKQNCTIELSSLSHKTNEITFKNDDVEIIMAHYAQNSEWNILSFNTSFINKKSHYTSYDEFQTIVAHFVVQRGESQLWRVFGTPTLLLAAMTMTTLWLNAKSNERLILGCVNFFCHFLCIGNLHWIIPDSDAIPNILMFYHNSIILAAFALILTCLFRKIIDLNDSPSPWISSSVSMILTSKIGQILLLCILDTKASALMDDNADDNSELVNDQTGKKSVWIYITIILGWISFIIYLIIYIIMFIIYLRMTY